MDVRLPDGTIITNVPDGISKAELDQKLSASGYDVAAITRPAPAPTAEPVQASDKTSNPLMGGLARVLELGGSGIEGIARLGEAGGDWLEKQLPVSGLSEKQIEEERQLEPLFKLAEKAKQTAKDIGYEPSTQLKDLSDNPLNVVPFVAERVITSSPDMAAAAFAFTPYVMTRTNEILNERLKNDGKTLSDATVGDVAAAAAGAVGEATLERFATKRILPGGKGVAEAPATGITAGAKRVGKEAGVQAGTEAAEETISYGGESLGTKKGFDPEEAGLRALEAGIVGSGLGGAARGAREAYDYYKPTVEEPVVEKLLTKGERKDMEQAEDRAIAVPPVETAPPPVTGKEPWEEIADELLKPKPEIKPIEETLVKPPLTPIEKPIDMGISKGKIEGVDEIDVNPNDLQLSKDVPQFKEDADEQGIVEPLKGKKYDYVGTPPIQVWRRLDGSLEVISGRHRWDLAKRTGADRIPAQVFDEAKGFNADMAGIMDAELNIRDGKGKITDYVNYFKTTGDKYGLTKEDYESRGLLDGKEGKRAYTVTVQGSDELIQALRGKQVKEDTAFRIADAVPNDARLQALGLKLVNEKPLEQAINILHAAKTIEPKAPEGGGEFDLFGFDDSGFKLAEDMGKLALQKQRELSEQIKAIKPAAQRADLAKARGVKVGNPEKVLAQAKELEALRNRWDNWASDPELVDQIRRELAGEPAVEAAPSTKPVAKKKPAETKVKAAERKLPSLELEPEYVRVDSIDRFPMGPTSIKPVVIEEGNNLYHETNVEGLNDILGLDRQFNYVPIFVSNNEDIAIGQGANKGVHITFRPNALSGKEHAKPGTGDLAGKEYKVDVMAPRAVQAIVFDSAKDAKKIRYGAKVALQKEFDATVDKDGRIVFTRKSAEETLPSFELEPEAKVTPIEKKAAAEREAKEIADREAEFFALTPRTPEHGAGNYLQQDMIGAMGLTEAEFKKGIDKKSTEPGEPLILRDVTMEESDTYNDEANDKVDSEIIGNIANMDNVKEVKLEEDVENTLSRQAQAVEDYIQLASKGQITAWKFFSKAKEDAAAGKISPDVFNTIEHIYRNFPSVLDGIRYEVVTGVDRTGKYKTAGHYQPLARMIRLFKDTSGVADPATVRHEIAHTMEQMMTPEQKRMVVRAWRDALMKATRAEKSEKGHEFFRNVAKFLHDPSKSTYKAVIKSMPNVSYYQYVNPSEYWAVNAEEILKSRVEGASSLRQNMEKLHEGLKQSFGMSNFWVGNKVFDQILTGDRFSPRMLINYLTATKHRNYLGDKAPVATWDIMSSNWLEDWKYNFYDKNIDLVRIQEDISRMNGDIVDELDPHTRESLSHSRISTRMEDFVRDYVNKLAEVMKKNGISQQQLHEYLLARHAPEFNEVVGGRNPEMGDRASSITTKEAMDYMRSLGEARIKKLDEAAAIIDGMTQRTRDILVDEGYEDAKTIEQWEKQFKYYVPFLRKDIEYGGVSGRGGSSKGRGKFSQMAAGSTKEVDDIGKNVVMEHLRAIEKVEDARIRKALFGLAVQNPNPDFWMPIDPGALSNPKKTQEILKKMGLSEELITNLMQVPKKPRFNPETELIEYVPSEVITNSKNVVGVRIDGRQVYLVFNGSNPRAYRLSQSIQNLDTKSLEGWVRMSAYVTRWIAQVNTQWNPVFGLWNFARDIQGAALNLSTTPLRGQEKAIMKGAFPAMRQIMSVLREQRRTGKRATTPGASEVYEFAGEGAVTGTKARFVDPSREKDLLQEAVNDMNKGKVKKIASYFADAISDWNDMLENAVRLSAYRAAIAQGLSKQQAASIAKNLTVNFNRKGAKSQNYGALYAFFNASVQGTARLGQTLKGPIGKKIVGGGIMLGLLQSAMMSIAGFEDDEPPEFVKEKNLIIPLGWITGEKNYLNIPMPLGYNVFPGVGRIMGEAIIGVANGEDVSKKGFDILSLVANSFNPLGSSGFSLQTIAPTPLDPFVAISQNKDAFGRPIYKEDRDTNPQVGYKRTRETTWEGWKAIAEFINYAQGGTEDTRGAFKFLDLTGDEISFLVGQATGGLGRDVMKTFGLAKDFVTGDETPTYKIPLIGKLYGNAESQAAVKNRFYTNVTKLAEMEQRIKGKRERKEDVSEFRREHPETQAINMANRIENEITQLNKRRAVLIKNGATTEQIKRIEEIKQRKMQTLNDRYNTLRKQ